MNMQVDESWRDYQSARVEFLPGAVADLVGWGNLGDTAIAKKNVHRSIDAGCGVDYTTTSNKQ
jgi:hypothetical protein